MKKRTFFIAIAVILAAFLMLMFLTSSKKEKVLPDKQVLSSLKKPFDAKATIKMKDLVLVADINKTAIGCATIKIAEPKTLADMEFKYDGENIYVSYKGFNVRLDENSKLVSSLTSILVNSIDAAASGSGIDVKIDGKVLTVLGTSESGKFSIKLDRESGSIASINLPELDFECSFDDFL